MRVRNKNKNRGYPNRSLLIVLFGVAALFETAFLGLTIPNWNLQSVSVYLSLGAVLQLMAYLKAVCIWRLCFRRSTWVYLGCILATALVMYGVFQSFVTLAGAFHLSVPLLLQPGGLAALDALLSGLLLYVFRSWLQVLLNNAPAQLCGQIRHHFLFNTLNTTVCLIDKNPALAQVILERLASLFRRLLFLESYISLEDELDSVRCYLRIEQCRLGERLQVSWQLDYEQSVAIRVPSLILQPLVENAIYHGVEKVIGGGTVMISLYTANERLIIQVCNPINGAAHQGGARSHHIAQNNIARRLALSYGDDFDFKQEQCEVKYRVTINIPKEVLL